MNSNVVKIVVHPLLTFYSFSWCHAHPLPAPGGCLMVVMVEMPW